MKSDRNNTSVSNLLQWKICHGEKRLKAHRVCKQSSMLFSWSLYCPLGLFFFEGSKFFRLLFFLSPLLYIPSLVKINSSFEGEIFEAPPIAVSMQDVLLTVLDFKPQLPASNFCGKNQELLLESLQES